MPRIIVPVVLLAASLGSARTAFADKPVTDASGYPVVGNAMTKGGPPRTQVVPPATDREGYPVVGNAMTKGGPRRVTTQPVIAASSAPAYDDAGYPVVGNAMSKAASAPPRLTAEQQRARKLLRSTSPTFVRANLTPYLPLCDAAGYPLVGNATASSKTARMQPSELCAVVREQRASVKPIVAAKARR